MSRAVSVQFPPPDSVLVACPQVRDAFSEKFVEVEALTNEKVDGRGLDGEPWVRIHPTSRPGPDVKVESPVGHFASPWIDVKGAKTELDQHKLGSCHFHLKIQRATHFTTYPVVLFNRQNVLKGFFPSLSF